MAEYWRFHVRLLDVDAKLWRRFLIKQAGTFEDLHLAIQAACGWENDHMFLFRKPDTRKPDKRKPIAGVSNDSGIESPDPDAKTVKLSSIFDAKTLGSCSYEYDFGDSWMHEVICEGVENHTERFVRRLLDGAGTFPPEDCGSSYGYGRCVAAATGKGWIKGMRPLANHESRWTGPNAVSSLQVQVARAVGRLVGGLVCEEVLPVGRSELVHA